MWVRGEGTGSLSEGYRAQTKKKQERFHGSGSTSLGEEEKLEEDSIAMQETQIPGRERNLSGRGGVIHLRKPKIPGGKIGENSPLARRGTIRG